MAGWVGRLEGRGTHGHELDWVGIDGDHVRSELGEGALSWAVETGEKIAVEVTGLVPAQGEGAHFNALRRATTSSVLRALLLIEGLETTGGNLIGPETVEVARDFARRGVSLEDLLRGIRHGFSMLAAALLDAADSLVEHDRSSELKRISLLLFGQIDSFMDIASNEYRQEKDDHAATVSAARFDAVQRIVSGVDPLDRRSTERLLDYPLDAPRHLALVAWNPAPGEDSGPSLRSTIDQIYRSLGATGPTLALPVGSHAMWSWRALEGAEPPSSRPDLRVDGRRGAVGQVGAGLAGFRRSHRQARAVEELVKRRPELTCAVITHADVELPALLSTDLSAAREFVARHLGPLAGDDPRMCELRQTLRCYLDHERSTIKVAAEKHISRNTVTYRVQQAMRLCGYRQGTSPLRLHAALSIVDWLD
jgi:hypothetical protein